MTRRQIGVPCGGNDACFVYKRYEKRTARTTWAAVVASVLSLVFLLLQISNLTPWLTRSEGASMRQEVKTAHDAYDKRMDDLHEADREMRVDLRNRLDGFSADLHEMRSFLEKTRQ